jgi:hypothetical protein
VNAGGANAHTCHRRLRPPRCSSSGVRVAGHPPPFQPGKVMCITPPPLCLLRCAGVVRAGMSAGVCSSAAQRGKVIVCAVSFRRPGCGVYFFSSPSLQSGCCRICRGWFWRPRYLPQTLPELMIHPIPPVENLAKPPIPLLHKPARQNDGIFLFYPRSETSSHQRTPYASQQERNARRNGARIMGQNREGFWVGAWEPPAKIPPLC